MKIIQANAVVAIALLMVYGAVAQTKPAVDKPTFRTIDLWPDGAPGATGTTDEDRPAIIPFLPAEGKQSGGAFTTPAVEYRGLQPLICGD